MGKTAFSGPVYGAKSLLFSAHRDNMDMTSSGTVVLSQIRVPSYEDWYVTEFKVYRGSSGSTAITTTFELADDSSVIANLATTSSAAGLLLSTTPTRTPGEYEGVQVLANSTLSVQFNNGGSTVGVSSNVTGYVYGFIRFIDSTRTE